jgi:hypothetical protein
MDAAHPTYTNNSGYCVVRWTLFFPSEGGGNAVVRAGSTTVLTVDVGNFGSIGTPGAGSGERDVAVSPPLAVAPGTVITLDLSGCGGCELQVTLNAASR